MPKLSVIMPSLNVVSYIEECMQSVINQDLHDIEIIIIDAGSTDGTFEIIKKYQEKDSRITVIQSARKSYGYQMNLGLARATGDYIGIVETDDIARKDMASSLYKAAVETNADYVKGCASFFYIMSDGKRYDFDYSPCPDLKESDMIIVNPSENPYLFELDNFLWNGIYRADFIKKILFHETPGAAFQDISELFRIISTAQKGVYINQIVYDYRQSNPGASSYNKKSFQYTADEYKYIQNYMSKVSDAWKKQYYDKLIKMAQDRIAIMASSGSYWSEAQEGITKLQELITEGMGKGFIKLEEYDETLSDFVENFLLNPFLVYEQFGLRYESQKEYLQKLVCKLQNKKFYIFGAGEQGTFLNVFFALNGLTGMQGFCDNSLKLQKSFIQGQKVFALNDIKEYEDVFFVVAIKKWNHEIKKQLIDYGVWEENIIIFEGESNRLLIKNFEN